LTPKGIPNLRYFCLISDYDGTLAHDGQVTASTLQALKRVKASGRKLVLATGRELPELLRVFPETSLFDLAVVENGALLYNPATGEKRLLAEPPPLAFSEELRRRGISPLSVGECIVATWHPHETVVLEVIRSLGLELQVIFNKDAVMILPSGVNKGTGVRVALDELGLSTHNTLGVGDAENDHAFLGICECSVAVGNALPVLKERADVVTEKTHGAGVEEIIEQLLADDLRSLQPRLKRHEILLGRTESGEEFCLGPYGTRVVIAGPSGGGKSTVVTAIVERLIQKQYQVCVVDPEGDYDDFAQFVTLGGADRIPGISEILEVLKNAGSSISVNLLGVSVTDRPNYFVGLLPRLQELRARTGRPHWIVIDEAHHLLPSELDSASLSIPSSLGSVALITVHPQSVSRALLDTVNSVIAIGPEPAAVIQEVNQGAGKNWALPPQKAPGEPDPELHSGEMLVWQLPESQTPAKVFLEPAKALLRRHKRKYAAGELGEDKSFYFRGPEGKLNLRAQNLTLFMQIAEGVDDETWSYHLKNHHYSEWLREAVKDEVVAEEIARIEGNARLQPGESRERILETIRKHYTNPA
jgi:hydroxymethylpyrimidine pyrophosphatase-like HAD family hydrolase/energy-coupling factor transporter ATP-binding protein EcfA2